MTEREQMRRVCGWNRELARDIGSLRTELHQAKREIKELAAANADLRVERDATDVLLGATMDDALEARQW